MEDKTVAGIRLEFRCGKGGQWRNRFAEPTIPKLILILVRSFRFKATTN